MSEKKTRDHVWECIGLDAGAYCQDCHGPANRLQHLTRANHHLYVCEGCAAKRLSAVPLRLREAA